MWDMIFALAVIFVAWRMLVLGLKAAWGIAKILAGVVFLPLFIAGLAFLGLFYIAVPVLVIVGIVALIAGA